MDWQSMGSETWVLLTTYGVRVVGVLVLLLAAWVVSGFIRRAMMRGFEKTKFDLTLSRFFANMARYSILTFAVLGCLGVFGIETSSFAAVIAAIGLAVGLAFQGTLSNFSAGVMLLVFRPFKVTDVVEVGGTIGTVQEIDLFTTDLTSPDNKRIVMPNSAIFGAKITNFSHFDTRRVDIGVGVDYGSDLRAVRDALEAMAPTIAGVIAEPPPQIFLEKLGASAIDWVVRVWCKTEDYWDVHQATILATKETLDAAGVSIPFPQMDVHLEERVVEAMAKE